MVVGRYPCVVVRHDDLLAAHHRTDGRAFGNGISATILPTTRELCSSPCTIGLQRLGGAAFECMHAHHVARRTYASSEPMVTVCGEMAMSMLLLSTSSVYEAC